MATIDLNDLSVFVTVVETASFSEAARRLGLPKSSVSRAIARLEDAIGARALHRTTRKVAPSTAGGALYDRVRADVASLRRSLDDLPERSEEPSGRIRVTAAIDLADMLAEVSERLTVRHSAVGLDLILTNDYVDLVADSIDLALRFSTKGLKDSSLNAKKLCPSRMQLFASPTYLARKGTPRAPRDLADHDWVVYGPLTEYRIASGGSSVTVSTHGRVHANDFGFVRAAVGRGAGLGFLGLYQAETDLAAGRLVRVLPSWSCHVSNLWAIWPGARSPSRKVAAFLDILGDVLASHPLSPSRAD
jgi:DNA-binding transcriptional LysR family regulator